MSQNCAARNSRDARDRSQQRLPRPSECGSLLLFHQLDETPEFLVDLAELESRKFGRIGYARIRSLRLVMADQRHEIRAKEFIVLRAYRVGCHGKPRVCWRHRAPRVINKEVAARPPTLRIPSGDQVRRF